MRHGYLAFMVIGDHGLDHRKLPREDQAGIDSIDSRKLPRDGQSDRQTDIELFNRFSVVKFSIRFHACESVTRPQYTTPPADLHSPMRQALNARLGHAAPHSSPQQYQVE